MTVNSEKRGERLVIRFANPEDDPAVRRLAALDSSSPPSPPLLLAEEGGELRAAISVLSRQVIADPFFATAGIVELLRARALQVERRRIQARPRRSKPAGRRRLPAPIAFGVVAAAIGIAFYASATPSPLYHTYQAIWHFSTPVLTLVYATYAIGVLGSLLLIGGVSDQVGRRPILLSSLVALLLSMGVFMSASSVTWLFVARAAQGLATGAALGAAGAALIDLHPSGDARHAALVNGTVSLGAIGVGALISSMLVQFLPAPRVVPFAVVAALLVLLLGLVWVMPEPVARRGRVSLRPQRLAVPASARGPFVLAAVGALSSWSIGGLYLALGPGLAGDLLHTHGALAGGIAAGTLMIAGALAQLAGRELTNRTLTTVGATVLATGMALTVSAVALGSAAAFLIATAVDGVGFGLAFMGALRHLSGAIPPNRRGEVMSAFYAIGYLSLSLPSVAAGFITAALGVTETFELFSGAAALLAMTLVVGGLRIEDASLRQPAGPDERMSIDRASTAWKEAA